MCKLIMNQPDSERKLKWRQLKSALILRFGTVSAAARHFKCTPNAIYQVAAGECPKVRRSLEKELGDVFAVRG